MRYILILLMSVLIISCNPDKKLERRVVALERRVTNLEEQVYAPKKSSEDSLTNDASGSQKEAKIQFEKTDYNFGSVKEGEIVDYNFKFTNTGDAPLIISRASASCGCTVTSPPEDPVQPGQSSAIHVRFNSTNKQNQQIKTITVESNTNPSITKLQIHGFVIPKNQSSATN
jgi:Protein of unknown function (DUF1573)